MLFDVFNHNMSLFISDKYLQVYHLVLFLSTCVLSGTANIW